VTAATEGVDVIVHIGAIGDVYLAGERPALAAGVNVLGTANVIDAALAHGARVVYASTWEAYGAPVFEPITEDHPTAPDHPYDTPNLRGAVLLLSGAPQRDRAAPARGLGAADASVLRPRSGLRIVIGRAKPGEPRTVLGDLCQHPQFP